MFVSHRAVKGSHILIGADGTVCLSGLRKSIMLRQEGDKSQMAHHFPASHAVAVLPWMAPEILQQVGRQPGGGGGGGSHIKAMGVLVGFFESDP